MGPLSARASRKSSSRGLLLVAAALVLFCSQQARAGFYIDDVGLTRLRAELGAAMPTGVGIRASQVEAELDSISHSYAPAEANFPGKTFSYKSGTYTPSWHATYVGTFLYGTWGAASGISTINNYAATSPGIPLSWMGTGFLRTGDGSRAPNVEVSRIQNHSWIGDIIGDPDTNIEILRRLDYAISRDGFLATVGMSNDPASIEPPLLGSSYNALAVGRTDGIHSHGYTTLDGAGRVRPDIVSPISPAMQATSYATPFVGSLGAVLLQTADNNSLLANARTNSEVMKAILMAGATKKDVAAWNRTTTSPLDLTYGAGQVNIYNSYHILTGGEHAASTNANLPGATLTDGWDFDTVTPVSGERLYFFDVPAGMALRDYSTVLNWNRTVTPVTKHGLTYAEWDSDLANLDLRLMSANNFVLGPAVDASLSTADNVEHIFRGATDANQPAAANELTAGQYALRVSASFAGTSLASADFALAWRGSLVVENPGLVEQPGDFNMDGRTDGLDFLVWQSHFPMTSSATLLQGDGTGDGKVDGLDFLTWQSGFTGGSMSPAPEPTTALVLLAAGCLLPRRPKR